MSFKNFELNISSNLFSLTGYSFTPPSWFPLKIAFGVLLLVLSFVMYLNYVPFSFWILLFSLSVVTFFVIQWTSLLIVEADTGFTKPEKKNLRNGWAIFIFSEARFFLGLFGTYFYLSLYPTVWIGGIWPPVGLTHSVVATWNVPLLNTIFLLSSGVSLTWAQYAARVSRIETINGLVITLFFALCFVYLQWYEYTHSSIDMSDSVYGSIFYRITGFHGFHVIIGAVLLLVCLFRAIRRSVFINREYLGFTFAIWYWHFVDIVWIFVFAFVYFWGNKITVLNNPFVLDTNSPNFILEKIRNIFIQADFPEPLQFNFQDPASFVRQSIISLHNYVRFYLVLIFIFVVIILRNALIVVETSLTNNKGFLAYKNLNLISIFSLLKYLPINYVIILFFRFLLLSLIVIPLFLIITLNLNNLLKVFIGFYKTINNKLLFIVNILNKFNKNETKFNLNQYNDLILNIPFSFLNEVIIKSNIDNNLNFSKIPTILNILEYKKYLYFRRRTHCTSLEVIWTLIPGFILLAIGIPSLILLYARDDQYGVLCFIVKVTGHQWYWSYEIPENFNWESYLSSNISLPSSLTEYDSYRVSVDDLPLDGLRLLEVDHPVYIPVNFPIKLRITSDDVIHSWSVPSLGIKVDAVPGRLNQAFTIIIRIGEFYGQCSELCGVNHAFMPIKVNSFNFSNDVSNKLTSFYENTNLLIN